MNFIVYSEVRQKFPEFSKSLNFDDKDKEYYIMGLFADFVITALRFKNKAIVQRSFLFINNCIEVADIDVQNIIEVQLFEAFLDKPVIDKEFLLFN